MNEDKDNSPPDGIDRRARPSDISIEAQVTLPAREFARALPMTTVLRMVGAALIVGLGLGLLVALALGYFSDAERAFDPELRLEEWETLCVETGGSWAIATPELDGSGTQTGYVCRRND